MIRSLHERMSAAGVPEETESVRNVTYTHSLPNIILSSLPYNPHEEGGRDLYSSLSAKALSDVCDTRAGNRGGLFSDVLDGAAAQGVSAVLVRSGLLDDVDVWLVADELALEEHPDIVASGAGVFFFDEIDRLRGREADELRALIEVKRVFPTGRITG